MSGPAAREVVLAGGACRVWEKGEGPPVTVLAGLGGFPSWTPFLEALAASRRVVVPSLPGFPGGGLAHKSLDDTIDWVVMGLDLLDACGLDETDLVGLSVGGMLANVALASQGFTPINLNYTLSQDNIFEICQRASQQLDSDGGE